MRSICLKDDLHPGSVTLDLLAKTLVESRHRGMVLPSILNIFARFVLGLF
jgi:hypothetical protein